MRVDILDYEKKLLENRRQLNELIAQSEDDNSLLVRDKINYLQNELAHMSYQLSVLKAEFEQKSCVVHKSEVATAEIVQVPEAAVGTEPVVSYEQEHCSEQNPQAEIVVQRQAVEHKKKDFEKTVGRTLMGIFASVLIFISLILFAQSVLPNLTDAMKMIVAYVISFAFVGFGLFKLRKDKTNKFYIALASCGVGALYVSVILTHFYFKAINDITLYILIAVWAIFVCYLSRQKNRVFQIIGQVGIFVSVCFGTWLCLEQVDIDKFAILVLFYVITSGAFYVVNFEKEFFGNILHHIFNLASFSCLFYGCKNLVTTQYHWLSIVTTLLMVVYIALIFYHSWEKSNVSVGLVLSAYMFAFVNYLGIASMNKYMISFGIYATSMAVSILSEFKKEGKTAGKYIAQILTLIWSFSALGSDVFGTLSYGVLLVIIPLSVLGFYRENVIYKYGSVIALAVYILSTHTYYLEKVIFGLVALAAIYFMTYKTKEQCSKSFNTMLHLLAMLFLSFAGKWVADNVVKIGELGDVCGFTLPCAFNLVMERTVFAKNMLIGDGKDASVYKIMNSLMGIAGLFFVVSTENIVLHMIVIAVSVLIFVINAKHLLDEYKGGFAGFYVGFKMTILLFVIMSSFDAYDYMMSVAYFMFAIVAIVVGFKLKYKSLRIYGLILSMISVFKLIMVDIRYTDMIKIAISFFVSGVLCFAISLIYNYIDKKLVKKSKDDEESDE